MTEQLISSSTMYLISPVSERGTLAHERRLGWPRPSTPSEEGCRPHRGQAATIRCSTAQQETLRRCNAATGRAISSCLRRWRRGEQPNVRRQRARGQRRGLQATQIRRGIGILGPTRKRKPRRPPLLLTAPSRPGATGVLFSRDVTKQTSLEKK